jgi:abortive infection bacteriophage resistance protein
MAQYNKPFLNIDEQVKLLKSRGLIFTDEERVKFYIKHIGYYHLSIYAKAYQNPDNQFKTNTTFDDILNLYNFDKKLRILILDILERVEMSFKCVLSYEITRTRNDNFWYTTDKNEYGNSEDKIKDIISGLKDSKEVYIDHFYQKYPESEYPPAWIFFESMTFGECSLFVRNLGERERQVIAGSYKLSKAVINMFYHLSHLRNACAHHSRIWNRRFITKIAKYPKYSDAFNDNYDNSLYSYLVIMQILIIRISPESNWLDRLNNLIDEYKVDINRMGFPTDWKCKLESIK